LGKGGGGEKDYHFKSLAPSPPLQLTPSLEAHWLSKEAKSSHWVIFINSLQFSYESKYYL